MPCSVILFHSLLVSGLNVVNGWFPYFLITLQKFVEPHWFLLSPRNRVFTFPDGITLLSNGSLQSPASRGGWLVLPGLPWKVKVKWKSLSCVDSLWTHGPYSPWNSPGQNTGVGNLSLLQGIFPIQGSNPGLPHCRQIFLLVEPQSPGLSQTLELYYFALSFLSQLSLITHCYCC